MTTPVILLHSLGSDRHFWHDVIPHLATDRVCALDLPGHGQGQDLPAGAGLEFLAASVISEMDAMGIRQADVIGVSLGGLVAQYLASRSPDRVRRIVLVDTVTVYPQQMRKMWTDRSALVRAAGTDAVVQATLDMWFTSEFLGSGSAAVGRTRDTLVAMSAEQYARNCELLAAVDVQDDVARIAAPTLVVCGDGDGPAFVAAAQSLAAGLNTASLEWLDGRHAVVLERPAEFAQLVNSFLADQDVSESIAMQANNEVKEMRDVNNR